MPRRIIHLIAIHHEYADGSSRFIAFCGKVGVCPDGWDGDDIEPDDFDCVYPPDPLCICDCQPCLDAWALYTHVTTRTVLVGRSPS